MRLQIQRNLAAVAIFALAIVVAAAGTPTAFSSGDAQGDADCNGQIGAPDASAILGQAGGVSNAACPRAADTNCDALIDARDALNVLMHAGNLDVQPPEWCIAMGQPLSPVIIAIDPSLQPSRETVDAMDGGPAVPVGVGIEPGGVRTEFLENEILYKADNPADIQAFMDQHNATIIRDGITDLPPGNPDASSISAAGTQGINHGWYLLRIDPSSIPLDGLAGDLADAGGQGTAVFSSVNAAKNLALAAGDEDNKTIVSAIGQMNTTQEHPMDATGTTFLDADTLNYYTQGAAPSYNIGVSKAWSYLRYQNIPAEDDAIPFQAVRVAVIDTGFYLNTSTGFPADGNPDYDGRPLQYDEDDDDYTAGGEAKMQCSGGGTCNWHGQGSFGTCCAKPNNQFGGAGSGGAFVKPMVINVNDRVSTWADAIRHAELFEADVITMSFSYSCDTWCGWFDGDIGDATDDAGQNGRIMLAAAGNSGVDIGGDDHQRPCEFPKVICVGSIDSSLNNLRNYGTPVDIWGVEGILSTVTPESADDDVDDFGSNELYNFNGTSAATPFVAGIVALAKSLTPGLTYSQALSLLAFTSNSSPDPLVTKGYVNAIAAALETRPNVPPTILDIPTPQAKTAYGYRGVTFRVDISDPEPGSTRFEFENQYRADFTTSTGANLCTGTQIIYRLGVRGLECTITNAPIGTFTVNVKVTDPFGASADADVIEVEFKNTPPIVDILEPDNNEIFYETQSIEFSAYIFDPEESVIFDETGDVVWSSNISGQIGFGSEIEVSLPQGTHTITVSATDTAGVTVTDTVTVIIQSGAGIPTVNITAPPDDSFYGIGQQITFEGNATDPEDGSLIGTSLAWYSSIDGFLGNGETLTTTLSGFPCFTSQHDHARRHGLRRQPGLGQDRRFGRPDLLTPG